MSKLVKKRLVKLTTIFDEEILCVLVVKDKISHTFETNFGPFTILNDDIKYIDIIGEVS